MLIVVQFTACRLLACLVCACKAVMNRTTAKVRAWFEFDWPPRNFRRVRFEIYWPLRKFGASAFCKLLSERCWNSYCSVVSLVCSDTLSNFSASLPRNGNVVVQRRTSSLSVSCRREPCCSSFDIFSSRVSSSWTLVFNADHQLDDHREFRETSMEAAGSYRLIGSGRIVSSGLDC